MKKVSIITRCFNRLEYTIMHINSIRDNTSYENYEHIIINNNSTDGTKEWFAWAEINLKHWFPNVRIVNLDKNLGCWGGILESLKYVSKDSEYVLPIDNDFLVSKDWIKKMVYVLDHTDAKIVQIKREGAEGLGLKGELRGKIKVTNLRDIMYGHETLWYGNINRAIACFILRTEDFRRVAPKIDKPGPAGQTQLSELLRPVIKVINIPGYVIDGWDGKQYINYVKYKKGVNPEYPSGV